MLDRMRRLVILVSTVVFIDTLLFGVLTPLIPGYAEEFDLSKLEAGVLVGAFGAGALVGSIPGGLATLRLGPKRTVVAGLVLLAGASITFAIADEPLALGISRALQGVASVTTWAGALAWLTTAAPKERRGEVIGTMFGFAVAGAILGPAFGALAHAVSPTLMFSAVGVVGLGLAVWAASSTPTPPERQEPGAIARALHDPRFVGGLWLNALPAYLFGIVAVLVPLALDDGSLGPVAIAAVFLGAGAVEVCLNPVVGRLTDQTGPLVPIRFFLALGIVASIGLALASRPLVIIPMVILAAIAFGGFYTPGMAMISHRAESLGLAQGLAFGVMNAAWATGELTGPSLGGQLADVYGDGAAYLTGAALCAATLAATMVIERRVRVAA
jgi:MFS family permease